jgi:hypothetical protein
MVSFKGAHFAKDIILVGVRWYVSYPLSYRHVEELMEERGVSVDHAIIQRWVVPDQSLVGSGVSSPQAPGMDELADGCDVYEGERRMALPLSCRG